MVKETKERPGEERDEENGDLEWLEVWTQGSRTQLFTDGCDPPNCVRQSRFPSDQGSGGWRPTVRFG